MKTLAMLVLGVPLLLLTGALAWVLAEQWWLGLPQDGCSFGSVDNARYREMYAEARALRWERFEFVPDDRAIVASVTSDIDAIATPKSGIYNRIAATHGVMRANGFVLARDWTSVLPRQWKVPLSCDPHCGYSVSYVGPRIHGAKSLFFGASRRTIYVNFALYTRPNPPSHISYLKIWSGRTRVNVLTPNFKGPGQDLIVSRSYSCPSVPPGEWAAEFDRNLKMQINTGDKPSEGSPL